MAMIIIGLVIGLVVGEDDGPDNVAMTLFNEDGPEIVKPVSKQPTLHRIRERGFLRCGLTAHRLLVDKFADLLLSVQNNSLVQNASIASDIVDIQSPRFFESYVS